MRSFPFLPLIAFLCTPSAGLAQPRREVLAVCPEPAWALHVTVAQGATRDGVPTWEYRATTLLGSGQGWGVSDVAAGVAGLEVPAAGPAVALAEGDAGALRAWTVRARAVVNPVPGAEVVGGGASMVLDGVPCAGVAVAWHGEGPAGDAGAWWDAERRLLMTRAGERLVTLSIPEEPQGRRARPVPSRRAVPLPWNSPVGMLLEPVDRGFAGTLPVVTSWRWSLRPGQVGGTLVSTSRTVTPGGAVLHLVQGTLGAGKERVTVVGAVRAAATQVPGTLMQ